MRTRGLLAGFISIAALGVVGCASGNSFQRLAAPEGKSVIYAYRSSSPLGGAIKPVVHCGAESVVLSRGEYHPFIVDPGTVTCHASSESTSVVKVDAKAAEENYVRESIGFGVFAGRPHLVLMDKQTGKKDVSSCALQD